MSRQAIRCVLSFIRAGRGGVEGQRYSGHPRCQGSGGAAGSLVFTLLGFIKKPISSPPQGLMFRPPSPLPPLSTCGLNADKSQPAKEREKERGKGSYQVNSSLPRFNLHSKQMIPQMVLNGDWHYIWQWGEEVISSKSLVCGPPPPSSLLTDD